MAEIDRKMLELTDERIVFWRLQKAAARTPLDQKTAQAMIEDYLRQRVLYAAAVERGDRKL